MPASPAFSAMVISLLRQHKTPMRILQMIQKKEVRPKSFSNYSFSFVL